MIEMRYVPDGVEPLFRVGEVVDMLNVSKTTLYRMIDSGELETVEFGGRLRVPESSIHKALNRGRARAAARLRKINEEK